MSVEVSLVKVEKLVVNNPKAMAVLGGMILILVGVALPNLWIGLFGAGIVSLVVLGSLPRDVRRWLMRGLGRMAKDVWES